MTTIMCLCTQTNGLETIRNIEVPQPPDVWDPSDAKRCVKLMQMATASLAHPLECLAAVRVHDTDDPYVVTLEVVTNAGAAFTEPLRIDATALAWLDELADTFGHQGTEWWTIEPPVIKIGPRLH
jgi:hypothetical protein